MKHLIYDWFNPSVKRIGKKDEHNYTEASYINDLEYQETFDYLCTLVTNLWKWNGLPDTCNERKLNYFLFKYGKVFFFNDGKYLLEDYPAEKDGVYYYHLPFSYGEKFDVYGTPTIVQTYGVSKAFQKRFSLSQGVVIRNDDQEYPEISRVLLYSRKLSNASRTADVCSENMKMPYILRVEQEQYSAARQMIYQVKNNEPAILAPPKTNAMGDIEILETGTTRSPQILTSANDHYNTIMNRFLTRYGWNSAAVDKKERVSVPETNSNNAVLYNSIQRLSVPRETSCEEINKMFGLSISVEIRKEVQDELLSLGTGNIQSNVTGANE